MLTIPTLPPLSYTRAAGALLAGTLLPMAGALAAGIALGDDDFNVAAGVGVGVVLAAGTTVVLCFRATPARAAEPSDPDVAEPLGALPTSGTTVRVRAHFGPGGGYVEHDGLLLWAEPAPGTDWADLRPGRLCRVEAADDRPVLTVTTNRTTA